MKHLKSKVVLFLAFVCLLSFAGTGVSRASSLEKGQAESLEPGITYYTFELTNWEGNPVKGYAVEIDPQEVLVEIRLVSGMDSLGEMEHLSSMAKRYGAVAAVNGGFFDPGSGHPVGGLVMDKALKVNSEILRTSIGLAGKGDLKLGYFNPRISVTAGGSNFPVTRVNRHPGADEIALYTPEWGSKTPVVAQGQAVAVGRSESGTSVVEKSTGQVNIPKDGYALVFSGKTGDWASLFESGKGIGLQIDYGNRWEGLKHLVTGGPLLVEDGVPVFNALVEGFRGSVLQSAARTAIGEMAGGKVLLVVVDGQKGAGYGLTFEELAWLMAELGTERAAALDGGSSTAMWVDSDIVNNPSGGSERRLANAILVLRQVPVYLNGDRIFFDVPPLVKDGRTLVPLRKIFEALGARVDWEKETQTITANLGEREIQLEINSEEAFVNGEKVFLDAPSRVVEGRTLVPLRFVGESLGAQVHWQDSPPAVFIKNSAEGVS
ncbi:MAG: copper amine oxidase [Firmicutes bacterium]|nr:copper amine oxidase [Bacillota bacterium]